IQPSATVWAPAWPGGASLEIVRDDPTILARLGAGSDLPSRIERISDRELALALSGGGESVGVIRTAGSVRVIENR
ncbi:MAG: hypothetical protein ABMA01_23290, partial [Chthoniobacteraceae bacterium]